MDVTPTPKMYQVMEALTTAMVGEAPGKLETTPAAEKRRRDRGRCMDVLHTLVRLSMREGVARFLKDRGHATVQDQVPPDPLVQALERSRETVEIGS